MAAIQDGQRPSVSRVAFVSNDRGFDQGTVAKRFQEHGARAVLLADITKLNEQIRVAAERFVTASIRAEREELRAYLESQRNEISSYLKAKYELPVDKAELNSLTALATVQRVTSLTLDAIDSAFLLNEEEGPRADRQRFVATLKVTCGFEFEMTMFSPSILDQRLHSLEAGGARRDDDSGRMESKVYSRTLRIDVHMQGTLVKDGSQFREMVIEQMR